MFVNGRLRERDILRHIPTARICPKVMFMDKFIMMIWIKVIQKISLLVAENGLFQMNLDFKEFIDEFEKLFKRIIEDWDVLRRDQGDDGDPDNVSITPRARKAQELFNTTLKDMGKQ